MILTKEDLNNYLLCDKRALGKNYSRPKWNDEIWKFEIALRHHEYHYNNKDKFIHKILCFYWAWRHHKIGVRLNFTIPVNTCGKGLRLNHYGTVIINSNAIIGDFCDIHADVNIGQNGGGKINGKNTPIIGNNVWIGPGAKLFGKITIADYCQIGANAVVNKSFNIVGAVLVGCPAKIIKINTFVSKDNINNKET